MPKSKKKSAVKTKNNQTVAYVKLPEPLGVSGNFHFPLIGQERLISVPSNTSAEIAIREKAKSFFPKSFNEAPM